MVLPLGAHTLPPLCRPLIASVRLICVKSGVQQPIPPPNTPLCAVLTHSDSTGDQMDRVLRAPTVGTLGPVHDVLRYKWK